MGRIGVGFVGNGQRSFEGHWMKGASLDFLFCQSNAYEMRSIGTSTFNMNPLSSQYYLVSFAKVNF
jgi:hypothetical protein